MSHAAALADEGNIARDQRVAQTLEAVNTLSRAIGNKSAQLQQKARRRASGFERT